MWRLIPGNFRKQWKDLEVHFLVLSSLLLQLILIPTGTIRKTTHRPWIQILVWITYVTADSVPILTLGVISNWLSNLKDQNISTAAMQTYELSALWAPLVLVHLGGPDSITAFTLEDNSLWLRHLAKVIVQTGWACYIYLLVLPNSLLSYIAMAVLLIGILKNLERTSTMFYASKDEFRHSSGSGVLSRLFELLRLKKTQAPFGSSGSGVLFRLSKLLRLKKTQAPFGPSHPKNILDEITPDANVYVAYKFVPVFEDLLAGVMVNPKALDSIAKFLKYVAPKNAFKIMDIELNIMFESLYTKASKSYSPLGVMSKMATLVLTAGVLVAFCMVDKRAYIKHDLYITFMVILGLLLNEIYSIIKVLSSDHMYGLLIERGWNCWYRIISNVQSCNKLYWLGFTTEDRRWPQYLTQLNILGLAVKKIPVFLIIHRFRLLYERTMPYFGFTYEPLTEESREWIVSYLKEKAEVEMERRPNDTTTPMPMPMPWLPTYGAAKRLQEFGLQNLIWSTPENDFHQSIVIWHVATEILCYDYEDAVRRRIGGDQDMENKFKISRTLSKYLIYLLVKKPAMMPIGIRDNYYAQTHLEARKVFEREISRISSHQSKNFRENEEPFRCKCIDEMAPGNEGGTSTPKESPKIEQHKSEQDLDICRFCRILLQLPHDLGKSPELVEGEDQNKSVLLHASHLASQLKENCSTLKEQWDVIASIWTEAILYSAYHSSGDIHAKQLSFGGEFLTHVWLLMAHFGISKQVKAPTTTLQDEKSV